MLPLLRRWSLWLSSLKVDRIWMDSDLRLHHHLWPVHVHHLHAMVVLSLHVHHLSMPHSVLLHLSLSHHHLSINGIWNVVLTHLMGDREVLLLEVLSSELHGLGVVLDLLHSRHSSLHLLLLLELVLQILSFIFLALSLEKINVDFVKSLNAS